MRQRQQRYRTLQSSFSRSTAVVPVVTMSVIWTSITCSAATSFVGAQWRIQAVFPDDGDDGLNRSEFSVFFDQELIPCRYSSCCSCSSSCCGMLFKYTQGSVVSNSIGVSLARLFNNPLSRHDGRNCGYVMQPGGTSSVVSAGSVSMNPCQMTDPCNTLERCVMPSCTRCTDNNKIYGHVARNDMQSRVFSRSVRHTNLFVPLLTTMQKILLL